MQNRVVVGKYEVIYYGDGSFYKNVNFDIFPKGCLNGKPLLNAMYQKTFNLSVPRDFKYSLRTRYTDNINIEDPDPDSVLCPEPTGRLMRDDRGQSV